MKKSRGLKGSLVLILLFVLSLSSIQVSASSEVPKQSREFYVNDMANVISSDTERYVINSNEELFRNTGAQVVVMTIDSLDGQSIDELANQVYRDYGIGDKERNNGVLILMAIEDREVRIEVGYGLEGAIPDITADQIIRNEMVPPLQEGNYDLAVTNSFKVILGLVNNEYGLQDYQYEEKVPAKRTFTIIIIVIVGIILVIIDFTMFGGWFTPQILRMILLMIGSGGGRDDDNYGGGGSSGGGGASGGW